MGLDQAILIGPKGEAPEAALATFRKHDRLHGYMERLSYQKGIVDPFDQLMDVDWEEIEARVGREIQEQFGAEELVMHPKDKDVEELSSEKKPKSITYTPTFDLEAYSKGRLKEELVPLMREDFELFAEAFVRFTEADTDVERDELLPPCKGFFFGESSPQEWAKTFIMLRTVFEQLGFEEYDYYYHCNW